MKSIALASGLALLAIGALSAQETSGPAFQVGAGFTTPVGSAGRNLDMGYNITAGAGFNFVPWVGALLDASYNNMGVTSSALGNLGYAGGTERVFALTLDPIVHIHPKGHVSAYLTGGGGYYHAWQTFTNPGIAYGTGFDPFFGFYPYAVGVNVVEASYSVNKPGIDLGAGIEIGTRWHGKFFAEARWNRIYTNPFRIDYIPVTFGFRF